MPFSKAFKIALACRGITIEWQDNVLERVQQFPGLTGISVTIGNERCLKCCKAASGVNDICIIFIEVIKLHVDIAHKQRVRS